jgi:glutaredoxin
VREFLSQNSVEYEERNIAQDPRWRRSLEELTGEAVVPVLLVGGKRVIGLDERRMGEALGLEDINAESNRDGLAAPRELEALPQGSDDPTVAALINFARRLQREMEYNAAKEGAPYRDGQHDGMRFARDTILRILDGTYESEGMVIERGHP